MPGRRSCWPSARSSARRSRSSESLSRRYGRLAAERGQLDREVHAAGGREATPPSDSCGWSSWPSALRDRWASARGAWTTSWPRWGRSRPCPPDAVAAAGRPQGPAGRSARQRLEQLDRQREELRREAAGPGGQRAALARQAARIEALAEQEPWIGTLARPDGRDWKRRSPSCAREPGRRAAAAGAGPGGRRRVCRRCLAAGVWRLRGRRPDAAEVAAGAAGARPGRRPPPAKQAVAALTHRSKPPWPPGSRRTWPRPSTAPATWWPSSAAASRSTSGSTRWPATRPSWKSKAAACSSRQLLPVWRTGGLGGVFVLGVVLLLAGLFMPASITGSLGWALALLGLVGSGGGGRRQDHAGALQRPAARRLPEATPHAPVADQAGRAGARRAGRPASARRRTDGQPAGGGREGAGRRWRSLRRWTPAARPPGRRPRRPPTRAAPGRARTRRRPAPLARGPGRRRLARPA